MFRKFLLPSVGALALLLVLGAPGQVHAQRMRGMSPNMRGMTPNMRGMTSNMRGITPNMRGMTPNMRGINSIRILPSFQGGRFNNGFDIRFNNGFFNSGFNFNRGFFGPGMNSGFGLGFFRPF